MNFTDLNNTAPKCQNSLYFTGSTVVFWNMTICTEIFTFFTKCKRKYDSISANDDLICPKWDRPYFPNIKYLSKMGPYLVYFPPIYKVLGPIRKLFDLLTTL